MTRFLHGCAGVRGEPSKLVPVLAGKMDGVSPVCRTKHGCRMIRPVGKICRLRVLEHTASAEVVGAKLASDARQREQAATSGFESRPANNVIALTRLSPPTGDVYSFSTPLDGATL